MRQASSYSCFLLALLDKVCPEQNPSALFWEGEQMLITKFINGEFITKEAARDISHKGFRYDWIENLNNN